jgi:hypothetical protein
MVRVGRMHSNSIVLDQLSEGEREERWSLRKISGKCGFQLECVNVDDG